MMNKLTIPPADSVAKSLPASSRTGRRLQNEVNAEVKAVQKPRATITEGKTLKPTRIPIMKRQSLSSSVSSQIPTPMSIIIPTSSSAPTRSYTERLARASNIPQTKVQLPQSAKQSLGRPTRLTRSSSKTSLNLEIGKKKVESKLQKPSYQFRTPTMKLSENITKPTRSRSGFSLRSQTVRSLKSEETIGGLKAPAKIKITIGDHTKKTTSAQQLFLEKRKFKTYEDQLKRLRDLQSDFLDTVASINKTSPNLLQNNVYKFVSVVNNDECKWLVNPGDQRKLPKHLPSESVNDFKEKIRNFLDTCIQNICRISKCAENLQDSKELYDNIDREKNESLDVLYQAFDTICEIYEDTPLHRGQSREDIAGKQKKLLERLSQMESEHQILKKSLEEAGKQIALKEAEKVEQLSLHERKLTAKFEGEILEKELRIGELEKKIDTFEQLRSDHVDESIQQQAVIEKLEEELADVKEINDRLKHDLKIEKTEKKADSVKISKLNNDLIESIQKYEELDAKYKSDITDLQVQIAELEKNTETIQQLENERIIHMAKIAEMEKELEGIETLKDEIEEIKRVTAEQIKACKEIPEEVKMELNSLKKSEEMKNREIRKLRIDLMKAKALNEDLEDQISQGKQLLAVRSETIDRFEIQHKLAQTHFKKLGSEIKERKSAVDELNFELKTKEEEFRNLFNTLSAKQMELNRLNRMYKALQETNEKNLALRRKQEERIFIMEAEIASLRQKVRYYDIQYGGGYFFRF